LLEPNRFTTLLTPDHQTAWTMISETAYTSDDAIAALRHFRSMIEKRTFKKDLLQDSNVIEGLSTTLAYF
jgi:hypothetical protein